jgi:hypothetical protein
METFPHTCPHLARCQEKRWVLGEGGMGKPTKLYHQMIRIKHSLKVSLTPCRRKWILGFCGDGFVILKRDFKSEG